MALRRLAATLRRARALRHRLVPCLLAGLALGPGAASAQYMALTPPKADARPTVAPKLVPPQARTVAHVLSGALPNQRTGPARERVVRDICIGCDR